MIRRAQLGGILLAVVVLVAGAAAPAAANPASDILSGDDEDGLLPDIDSIVAGIEGTTDRISAWADRIRTGGPPAEETANETTSTFNANSESIVSYVNERATVDSDHEIVEITFVVGDDEAVRYLVGDVNESTGNYSSASMLTREEYDNRGLRPADVDEEVELSGFAAENAETELDTFVTDYVETDRDIGGSPHMSRMTTRYAGSVDASFRW